MYWLVRSILDATALGNMATRVATILEIILTVHKAQVTWNRKSGD